MSRAAVTSIATMPAAGPAPRCGDCGRFFKADKAIAVEYWITQPTPEPDWGAVYCNDCRPVPPEGLTADYPSALGRKP